MIAESNPKDIAEVAPFTIDEVVTLSDDFIDVVNDPASLTQFMMGNNDQFLYQLRDFVDRALEFRKHPSL